jgi:hypothetical protein
MTPVHDAAQASAHNANPTTIGLCISNGSGASTSKRIILEHFEHRESSLDWILPVGLES